MAEGGCFCNDRCLCGWSGDAYYSALDFNVCGTTSGSAGSHHWILGIIFGVDTVGNCGQAVRGLGRYCCVSVFFCLTHI